jgi:hypothetical protein
MTDIRKRGFESDAQWREYLEEIEEAARPIGDLPPGDHVLENLAALRTEVAALRERVRTTRRRNATFGWRRVVGLAALLVLVGAVGK